MFDFLGGEEGVTMLSGHVARPTTTPRAALPARRHVPPHGAIDDDAFPDARSGALAASLARVIHICTSDLQGWYELPDDGLPRLKYAG